MKIQPETFSMCVAVVQLLAVVLIALAAAQSVASLSLWIAIVVAALFLLFCFAYWLAQPNTKL